MSDLSLKLRAQARRPGIRKLVKYSLVSVIAMGVTILVQLICYGLFHISGGWSAIIASTVAAVPSYYLNRSWVWGKNGKSHIKREVAPFWIMVFVGLAASGAASSGADAFAQNSIDSHALRTLFVTGASVAAFAVLWVGKFILFNKILFVHHPKDLERNPALDGRAGLPT